MSIALIPIIIITLNHTEMVTTERFFYVFYICCFSISLGSTPWVYLSELLPERAMSISIALYWALHIPNSWIPEFTTNKNKVSYFLIFFCCASIFVYLYIYIYIYRHLYLLLFGLKRQK